MFCRHQLILSAGVVASAAPTSVHQDFLWVMTIWVALVGLLLPPTAHPQTGMWSSQTHTYLRYVNRRQTISVTEKVGIFFTKHFWRYCNWPQVCLAFYLTWMASQPLAFLECFFVQHCPGKQSRAFLLLRATLSSHHVWLGLTDHVGSGQDNFSRVPFSKLGLFGFKPIVN